MKIVKSAFLFLALLLPAFAEAQPISEAGVNFATGTWSGVVGPAHREVGFKID